MKYFNRSRKISHKKTSSMFWRKVGYEGDTNEKNSWF